MSILNSSLSWRRQLVASRCTAHMNNCFLFACRPCYVSWTSHSFFLMVRLLKPVTANCPCPDYPWHCTVHVNSWILPPRILPACIYALFPSAIHFTLKMEAARFSKRWYPTTSRHSVTIQKTTTSEEWMNIHLILSYKEQTEVPKIFSGNIF